MACSGLHTWGLQMGKVTSIGVKVVLAGVSATTTKQSEVPLGELEVEVELELWLKESDAHISRTESTPSLRSNTALSAISFSNTCV